jgi:hypothetical protein
MCFAVTFPHMHISCLDHSHPPYYPTRENLLYFINVETIINILACLQAEGYSLYFLLLFRDVDYLYAGCLQLVRI